MDLVPTDSKEPTPRWLTKGSHKLLGMGEDYLVLERFMQDTNPRGEMFQFDLECIYPGIYEYPKAVSKPVAEWVADLKRKGFNKPRLDKIQLALQGDESVRLNPRMKVMYEWAKAHPVDLPDGPETRALAWMLQMKGFLKSEEFRSLKDVVWGKPQKT